MVGSGAHRAVPNAAMPSPKHEALVMLFRSRPALAGELLRAFAVPVRQIAQAVVTSETLRSVQPVEIAADAVIVFGDAHEPELAVIVEVQLSPDDQKHLAWPCYLALLRRDLDCPCVLLVIALDQNVAAWATRPIALGHPGFELRPLVVGSNIIPRIVDDEVAAGDVELAVLSAVAHGQTSDALDIARTAVRAVHGDASLDDDRAALYFDLVLGALGAAARAALEAEMSSKYEFQTEFARKYHLARTRARAAGITTGEGNALMTILRSRGFVVDDAAATRIRECKDSEQLERWISRAVSAPSVDDVFKG